MWENPGGVDYFIGGGADLGCMNDLVVDRWASDGESNSHRGFLFLHDVRTTSNRLRSYEITQAI